MLEGIRRPPPHQPQDLHVTKAWLLVYLNHTAASTRYKRPLCLFVGVDEENHTVILAQALMCDETTATFEKVLQDFLGFCEGVHSKVRLDRGHALLIFRREVQPS